MAIFRMDKDQFRRQIAELEQAGVEYEGAKASLSSAVGNSCQDLQNTGVCTPSDDDRWSGLNELQQFRAPVHTSLFAVDKEMKELSKLQKATIEDLRSSLDSFTYRDDAERAEFAAALDSAGIKYERFEEPGGHIIRPERLQQDIDGVVAHLRKAE